jgi:hypothetical protein
MDTVFASVLTTDLLTNSLLAGTPQPSSSRAPLITSTT